ncbi:MAG TPA: hypothetical protein VEL73_07005 [Mycobacteriales bacterium]|nr:hypothetical protein [Mycobacteriales bacterium]
MGYELRLEHEGPPAGRILVGSYTELAEALTALDLHRERTDRGRAPHPGGPGLQRLEILDPAGRTVAASSYSAAGEPAPPPTAPDPA